MFWRGKNVNVIHELLVRRLHKIFLFLTHILPWDVFPFCGSFFNRSSNFVEIQFLTCLLWGK